jgi:beta-mannosidase
MTTQHLWHPYYIHPRQGAQHLDLAGQWQLQPADAPLEDPRRIHSWGYSADVPQTVHWSLYAAGVLSHPYDRRNIKQYAWVETKTWYYRRDFDAPPDTGDAYVFLCFDGVDHFCRVWLNGELLGRHEGMFGGPMLEVSSLLTRGQPNEVIVEVQAASFGQGADWSALRNKGRVIKPWGISRGHSAEDYMSVGIWRPVRLEIVPRTHLERPFLKTLRATDTLAVLDLTVEINCNTPSGQFKLNGWDNHILRDMRDRFHSKPWSQDMTLRVQVTDQDGGQAVADLIAPVHLYEGRNWVKQNLEIPSPKLWQPNGMGEPHLFHVQLTLISDGVPTDRVAFDYGIRTIQTVPTAGPQTTDRWANWQFVVNGKPFFVKGINWMPADQLLDLPTSRYRWLLEMARAAGIQMIRIWGGGLIETDDFYRLCDELGIMVWQDFPIGNSDSPDWPLDVWQAMVVMNIFRLRNHPSLAVWCGGNEFNPYSLGNTAVIGVVERAVNLFDGTRVFRRTSPDEGSIHTYPDMDPTWYQHLYALVPFIAETGIHSFPEARLLRELCNEEEFRKPLSGIFEPSFGDEHPDLRQHFIEYNPQRVPRMIARASHIADVSAPSLETLVEASQIAAGEFYQILSEVMQANYPATSGLLPWVYKRPWPNIGIQLVDGMGHAGACYYFLKRTYEPLHVMVQLPHMVWGAGEEVPMRARVLNLTCGDAAAVRLELAVLDAGFRPVWQQHANVAVPASPAVAETDCGCFPIPAAFADTFFLVVAEAHGADGALLSRSVYWPRCLSAMSDPAFAESYRAEPRPSLTLSNGPWLKPQVASQPTSLRLSSVRHRVDGDGRSRISCLVKNTGRTPAFPVKLDISGAKRMFYASDNYIWLAPGEERRLTLDVTWREPVCARTIELSVEAWNASVQSHTITL